MIPPSTTNVLDKHQGFTAVTKPAPTAKQFWALPLKEKQQIVAFHQYNTLWRPGQLLKKTQEGALLHFREDSFYQNNNDVTLAFYQVPGYNYIVACWFDNKTGERIA